MNEQSTISISEARALLKRWERKCLKFDKALMEELIIAENRGTQRVGAINKRLTKVLRKNRELTVFEANSEGRYAVYYLEFDWKQCARLARVVLTRKRAPEYEVMHVRITAHCLQRLIQDGRDRNDPLGPFLRAHIGAVAATLDSEGGVPLEIPVIITSSLEDAPRVVGHFCGKEAEVIGEHGIALTTYITRKSYGPRLQEQAEEWEAAVPANWRDEAHKVDLNKSSGRLGNLLGGRP